MRSPRKSTSPLANKYLCKLCDFVNTNKGGMKKHIRATYRNVGIKRSELDDTNEISDEKKAKTDEFEPNVTSTQKPQKAKMNLTVSALTNDFLRNLLENNEAFNEDGKQAPLDETVADEENYGFDDTPNTQVP